MANPRKFSEKIALHTHRQAEETARFEQIMKEVSDATARVNSEKSESKNTLRINHQALGAFRGGSLPNVSAQNAKNSPSHIKNKVKPEEISLSHTHVNVSHYRESRSRSQAGPIRRPQDRKHDTSPYSSGPFLSPPSDTSWRRTNSDSALHQSAMQGMSADRIENQNNRWLHTINGPDQYDNRRPRLSCDESRLPGINIYCTDHETGAVPIPIGNNTGSLPDLTNVRFPSPIHTPLDADHDQGSSPYSSSPVNTSPSTLSPTSMPLSMRQQGSFPFNTSQQQQQQTHHQGLENNGSASCGQQQDFSQMRNVNRMYQQVPPTSPSPTLQQVAGYRSPRPSPQSSPSLGGRHSAPCSPGVPSPLSPLPNDYQLYSQHQAAQLQQDFEQFSMGVDWAQLVASLVESGCTWSAQVQMDAPSNNVSYLDQSTNLHLSQPHTLQDVAGESTGDAGYYSTSPSQLVYHTAPPSLHTTPNTPTSIPDIILTDFSGEDIAREDLSLTKQLEAELFANESLREGLEPLDLDGLQMLSDSGINLIPDGVEDHFRLDRS